MVIICPPWAPLAGEGGGRYQCPSKPFQNMYALVIYTNSVELCNTRPLFYSTATLWVLFVFWHMGFLRLACCCSDDPWPQRARSLSLAACTKLPRVGSSQQRNKNTRRSCSSDDLDPTRSLTHRMYKTSKLSCFLQAFFQLSSSF